MANYAAHPEYAESPRQRVLWLLRHRQWTPEQFENEGVTSARNVRNIVKKPNLNVEAHTAAAIDRVWRTALAHPQAPQTAASRILESVNYYVDTSPSAQLQRDLWMIEGAIAQQLATEYDPLEKSILYMAAGHAQRARFKKLHEGVHSVEQSVQNYMSGVACLNGLISPAANVLRIRNRVNAFTVRYDAMDEKTRSSDLTILKWIRENELIGALLATCAVQPDNWRAARAGLVMASILNRRWISRRFFSLLTRANPKTSNLAFAPASDLKSIVDDPDCKFVISLFEAGVLPGATNQPLSFKEVK